MGRVIAKRGHYSAKRSYIGRSRIVRMGLCDYLSAICAIMQIITNSWQVPSGSWPGATPIGHRVECRYNAICSFDFGLMRPFGFGVPWPANVTLPTDHTAVAVQGDVRGLLLLPVMTRGALHPSRDFRGFAKGGTSGSASLPAGDKPSFAIGCRTLVPPLSIITRF
jgi:hypothetical protein